MRRPITRSMTRLMANQTKHSDLSAAASEENNQVCREPDSAAGPSYLIIFCQTFSFLLLPGEIRNMIYRHLLGPKFEFDWIISIKLFETQPAITRVNKQIRAESLSIYYAENSFWREIHLKDQDIRYQDPEGYVKFCDYMERFAPAQAQSPGMQSSLCHIRHLEARISLETYTAFNCVARFEKTVDKDLKSRADWLGWGRRLTAGRLGGDETDWADRTSVDALVKQWMEALPNNCGSPPYAQERLIHVLWLLGVNLTSDSMTLVSFDY